MIAISCNSSHATIYQNGQFRDMSSVLKNNIPTTQGFRIGGEVCCPQDSFHGLIKTVKVWNRGLSNEEINRSMYNIGTKNSTIEALHEGLVGHWELGDTEMPLCGGDSAINHWGQDWTVTDGQFVGGIHCNISKFLVPKGVTVNLERYNGKTGGTLDVTAQEVQIDGMINGLGAGYRGGVSSSIPGDGGQKGQSFSEGINDGGGGGGLGGNMLTDGSGRAGGGGGHGQRGENARIVRSGTSHSSYGIGTGGWLYNDNDWNILYMGAGGGSGGNAKDLTTNPKGGRGGNGGGGVKIVAQESILITGVIDVRGEHGQGDTGVAPGCTECPAACNLKTSFRCLGNSTVACWDLSAPGGGGAGGSIYLLAKFVNVGEHILWISGGNGGSGGGNSCGGKGGAGRIRIDSVVLKGIVADPQLPITTTTLQDKFVDHSQMGQKQINYQNTVYGNEVYRGCFASSSDYERAPLLVKLTLTGAMRMKMSRQYCQQLCRQQNYKFSGTQYGNECYCDNHLNGHLKRPDSQCDLACEGDPLQNCGGRGYLQIFGPPPGTPATGHNVVPKCEPWCVTADANTPNPKWGLCVNSPHSVADWTVQCQCPPGKTGPVCDQTCPTWKYGNGCRRNCTCNITTTAECNPSNGQCSCKPGYYGNKCEKKCQSGFYGQNCESTCSCSQNSQCDHVTGNCSCKPGWSGLNCNFPCPENTYGSGCTQKCNCNHGTCSPEDGSCHCHHGYQLPTCLVQCDNFTYGQDCLQQCDCNQQMCDSITGACLCSPGYIGPRCNIMCPFKTWGQNCVKSCDCGGYGCDHVTGKCQCGPGFVGDNCQHNCPYNSYGQDCAGTCLCVAHQMELCNKINGACVCLDGFYGFHCELPCQHGYYGKGCSKLCQCYNGATCDHKTGKCMCALGFTGTHCEQKCPSGKFGAGCEHSCTSCSVCNIVDGSCHNPCKTGPNCQCPNNTWGITTTCANVCGCKNGQCDDRTGECVCTAGWRGQHCDLPCSSGNYGVSCASVCTCVHGKCDPVNGDCLCSSGFNGTACNAECPSGTYGANCRFSCPTCGAHSYPGCDPRTGNCLCSDGYTGLLCDRPCPQGTYGTNCSSQCSCQNSAICDSVTGRCLCSPGYMGVRCEKQCPPGSWGLNCTRPCDCGPHGDGCSPVEGLCRCKPGYIGVKCRQSCPVSTYGQNCTSECRCPPSTSMCSPIDGSCLCKPGFKGTLCDQVCDPGFWGHECTQRCQCNNQGNCDSFTGECDCAAGYTGPHCETQCAQDLYWGKKCEQPCACNGGHCNHRSGVCSCPPGKTGQHCELDCHRGYYGFNCASACSCENERACDKVTGQCTCKEGWTGPQCSDTCPMGKYGADCMQDCPDCQNGGLCDAVEGKCICQLYFMGPLCNYSVNPQPLAHAQMEKLTSSSGIHFTVSQLAGLIVGFLLLLILATVLAVILTRRRYVGRFGNTTGAVKFTSEEQVDMEHMPAEVTTSSVTAVFTNPVHDITAGEETEFNI